MALLSRSFALLLFTASPAWCQVVLHTGDVWTWEFTNMPNVSTSTSLPGFVPVSATSMTISSYDSTVDVIRCEMLENGAADTPSAVGVRSCSASYSTWRDLQGMVRVTMVSGSVSLDGVTVYRCIGAGGGGPHGPYFVSCQSQSAVPTIEPRPRLYIASGGEDGFQFTWSTNYSGCSLEATEGIASANWQTITNEPTIVGPRYSITLPPAETRRYFRLRRD